MRPTLLLAAAFVLPLAAPAQTVVKPYRAAANAPAPSPQPAPERNTRVTISGDLFCHSEGGVLVDGEPAPKSSAVVTDDGIVGPTETPRVTGLVFLRNYPDATNAPIGSRVVVEAVADGTQKVDQANVRAFSCVTSKGVPVEKPALNAIAIISARFGREQAWAIVTQAVKDYAARGAEFEATLEGLHTPDPGGWPKELQIRYLVGGRLVEKTFHERDKVKVE